MVVDSVFDTLKELQDITRKQAQKYSKKRACYFDIFKAGKSFIGIAGLRGVGKTTILKQRLLENSRAMYIALDSFPQIKLFELAKELK